MVGGSQAAGLYGRERELQRLMGLLSNALCGRGCLVALRARTGMGSSALLQEFAGLAGKTDALVAVERFSPGLDNSLLPLHSGLAHLSAIHHDVSGRCSPEQEVLDGMRALCAPGHRPFVLILEDMHWAGARPFEVIHQHAEELRDRCGMILFSYRPEMLASSKMAGSARHAIEAMFRQGCMREIELGPIDRDGVARWMGAALGEVPPGLADFAMERTSGIPSFVRSLMEEMGRRDREEWPAILENAKFLEGLEREMELLLLQLTKEERMVLNYAAMQGENFTPNDVADSSGRTIISVTEMLEHIERTTGLIADDGERYRFLLPAFRTRICDGISPALRESMRRPKDYQVTGQSKRI